jgi:hypothetical protein
MLITPRHFAAHQDFGPASSEAVAPRCATPSAIKLPDTTRWSEAASLGILVLRPATNMIPYLGWGRFPFECSWHERVAPHFLSALGN